MRFHRDGLLLRAMLCIAAAAGLSAFSLAQAVRTADGYKETVTMTVPVMIDNTEAMMYRDRFMPQPTGLRVYPNVLHFDTGSKGEGDEEEHGGIDPGGFVDPVQQLAVGQYWVGPGEAGGTPCDPDIGVGPNHVVAVGNGAIKFYTKSGSPTFSSSLNAFWSGLSGVSVCCDCRVFYDWYSQRWFMEYLGFDSTNHSYVLTAVSDDSDPNGTWAKWAINTSMNGSTLSSNWSDYPGMGYNADVIMFTGNMFPISSGSTYGKIRVCPKAQFLSGSSTITYTDFWSFTNPDGSTAFSLQPGRHIGACTMPVVCNVSGSRVNVFGIQNPLSSPSLVKKFVAVNSWSGPATGVQKGSSTRYDELDDRIYDVNVRDNQVLVTHNISGGAGSQVRWYQINATNLPTSISLVQQGNIGSSSYFTGFGCLNMNQYGAIGTGLTRSSSTEYISVYYTGRVSTDAAGTMQPMTLHLAGTLGYSGEANPCRWGDYCGGALDPADDNTFWAIGMLPASTGSWKTEIYSYTIGSVGTTPTTVTENDISGMIGQTVTQSATLVQTSDSTPLSGKGLVFTVNSASSGTGSTNASGVATANFAIPESVGVGAIPINAAFSGDATYAPSSGNATLTVSAAPTALTVPNQSGSLGQTINLTATLKRTTDNAVLANKSVSFTVDGANAGSGSTNGSGVVTVSYTVDSGLSGGAHTIQASFAGTTLYTASTGTGTLTVTPGSTLLTVDDQSGQQGQSVPLYATLLRSVDSVVIPGRNIDFYVAGNLVGSATTNSSGLATYNYTVSYSLPLGANAIMAKFTGDSTYGASTGSGTLTVSAGSQATVNGNVALNGLAISPAGLSSTIEFRTPNTTNVLYSQSITLDGSGNYSATSVPAGTYDVALKFPNWLRKVLPSVVVSAPTTSGVNFTLINGDANSDNSVNLLDLSVILAKFGTSAAAPSPGDLNWDGTVNLLDLSLVLANFGATGAP